MSIKQSIKAVEMLHQDLRPVVVQLQAGLSMGWHSMRHIKDYISVYDLLIRDRLNQFQYLTELKGFQEGTYLYQIVFAININIKIVSDSVALYYHLQGTHNHLIKIGL